MKLILSVLAMCLIACCVEAAGVNGSAHANVGTSGNGHRVGGKVNINFGGSDSDSSSFSSSSSSSSSSSESSSEENGSPGLFGNILNDMDSNDPPQNHSGPTGGIKSSGSTGGLVGGLMHTLTSPLRLLKSGGMKGMMPNSSGVMNMLTSKGGLEGVMGRLPSGKILVGLLQKLQSKGGMGGMMPNMSSGGIMKMLSSKGGIKGFLGRLPSGKAIVGLLNALQSKGGIGGMMPNMSSGGNILSKLPSAGALKGLLNALQSKGGLGGILKGMGSSASANGSAGGSVSGSGSGGIKGALNTVTSGFLAKIFAQLNRFLMPVLNTLSGLTSGLVNPKIVNTLTSGYLGSPNATASKRPSFGIHVNANVGDHNGVRFNAGARG